MSRGAERIGYVTEVDLSNYAATLAELKAQIRAARVAAQRTVNSELIRLYWSIGRTILARQEAQCWGSKVIDQVASDLRSEFPEIRGFSPSNLKSMRLFARTWSDGPISQQAVGQLPWGHIVLLLEKLDEHVTLVPPRNGTAITVRCFGRNARTDLRTFRRMLRGVA